MPRENTGVIVVESPDTIVADVAVRDVATGRGVGGTVVEVVEVVEGTVVEVVEVVEGTVVVVTIGATVVVVTIDTTVVVETNEGTTVVVGATRTGAAVVDVVDVVEVVEVVGATVVVVTIGATVVDVVVTPVVPVLGEALEALSKTGTAPITESAITGNLTVKSVWLFAQFARTLTTNSLVRL